MLVCNFETIVVNSGLHLFVSTVARSYQKWCAKYNSIGTSSDVLIRETGYMRGSVMGSLRSAVALFLFCFRLSPLTRGSLVDCLLEIVKAYQDFSEPKLPRRLLQEGSPIGAEPIKTCRHSALNDSSSTRGCLPLNTSLYYLSVASPLIHPFVGVPCFWWMCLWG